MAAPLDQPSTVRWIEQLLQRQEEINAASERLRRELLQARMLLNGTMRREWRSMRKGIHVAGDSKSSWTHTKKLSPPGWYEGFCDVINQGENRECGEALTQKGSWTVPLGGAAKCVSRCVDCEACHFVSYDAPTHDCRWFRACNLRMLGADSTQHRTLAIRAGNDSLLPSILKSLPHGDERDRVEGLLKGTQSTSLPLHRPLEIDDTSAMGERTLRTFLNTTDDSLLVWSSDLHEGLRAEIPATIMSHGHRVVLAGPGRSTSRCTSCPWKNAANNSPNV